jgi:hypothetical protein
MRVFVFLTTNTANTRTDASIALHETLRTT